MGTNFVALPHTKKDEQKRLSSAAAQRATALFISLEMQDFAVTEAYKPFSSNVFS